MLTPAEIKAECERIWRDDGICHHHNITGWHLTSHCIKNRIGYYAGRLFTHFKGRRCKLLNRRAK